MRLTPQDYAIKKMLRKSLADCSLPMTPTEVQTIRQRLARSSADVNLKAGDERPPQLTYAEQDAALQARIPLPYRMRIRLPHVILAWKLRKKDPGSAPVPGEAITYVVTNNGGGKIFEKVEEFQIARAQHIPADRGYYLKSLKNPIQNIFEPIVLQQLRRKESLRLYGGQNGIAVGCDVTAAVPVPPELQARATLQVDILLWDIIKGRRVEATPEAKRARIEHSPLARAFARTPAPAPALMGAAGAVPALVLPPK